MMHRWSDADTSRHTWQGSGENLEQHVGMQCRLKKHQVRAVGMATSPRSQCHPVVGEYPLREVRQTGSYKQPGPIVG